VLCLADGRLRFGLEGEKEIKKCTNPCEEDQSRTDYVSIAFLGQPAFLIPYSRLSGEDNYGNTFNNALNQYQSSCDQPTLSLGTKTPPAFHIISSH